MKQLARYKILFDSKAIIASTALMGVAIFTQAIYFFVIRDITLVQTAELIVFLILPVVLELGWIILLRSVKLNASGVYGIVGSVVCLLLAVQIFLSGGVLQMVLGTIGYLIGCGLLLMITGGFFPYKYFGLAWFLVMAVIRYAAFDTGRYIASGDWAGFALEAGNLCVLLGLSLFFGGISGLRMKT